MTCPICKSSTYEKSRIEQTTGTFISIKCTNPECNYCDYKNIPFARKYNDVTGI